MKKVKDEKSSWWWLLFFSIPLAVSAWFAMQHLTQFETADEHFWISEGWPNGNLDIVPARIPTYWQALQQKDWAHTLINDKPGISLALISGLGHYAYDGWPDRLVQLNKFSLQFDPQKTEEAYYYFRLPLIILNGFLALFILIALRRLSKNSWTALLGASFIALSPVLIGVSQIVNPDALLWVFVICSILSYLLFVRDGKWWDVIFAALFTGLAFLSKYTAAILVPFFFVVILIYLFLEYEKLEAEGRIRKKIIFLTLFYPIIIVLGVLVFALGLPAVFLDHSVLFDGIGQIKNFNLIVDYIIYADVFLLVDAIILKSLILRFVLKYAQWLKKIIPRSSYLILAAVFASVFINWSRMDNQLLHLPSINYDDGDVETTFGALRFGQKLFLEFYPLVFSLTPVVLLGVLIAWLKQTVKIKKEDEFLMLSLVTFIMAFYVGVILQNLFVHVRYSLVVYPPVMIIAALGFTPIFNWSKLNNFYRVFIFLAFVGISSWNLWLAKPFYFNYTSELLPKKYMLSGGWGIGAYEVAQYIDAQANDPTQLIAWTDYEGFCPFFAGTCIKGTQVKWNLRSVQRNIDYYVVSRRGMMLAPSLWENFGLARSAEPVWELDIDGRPDNFIQVYRNVMKVYNCVCQAPPSPPAYPASSTWPGLSR